jgi:hypothetical protein
VTHTPEYSNLCFENCSLYILTVQIQEMTVRIKYGHILSPCFHGNTTLTQTVSVVLKLRHLNRKGATYGFNVTNNRVRKGEGKA